MDRTHRLGPDIAVRYPSCGSEPEDLWRRGGEHKMERGEGRPLRRPAGVENQKKNKPLVDRRTCRLLYIKKSRLVGLLHRIKQRRTHSPTWRTSAATAGPQTTRKGQFVVTKKKLTLRASIHQFFTFLVGYNLFWAVWGCTGRSSGDSYGSIHSQKREKRPKWQSSSLLAWKLKLNTLLLINPL